MKRFALEPGLKKRLKSSVSVIGPSSAGDRRAPEMTFEKVRKPSHHML
jgi:hypothetical protein